MATAPEHLTLRPLTAEDALKSGDIPHPTVYIRRDHAGETFYAPAHVKSITASDVYTGGLYEHQLATARKNVERVVIGQHIEVVARDIFGSENTDYVDTSEDVFDALYPEDDKYATRQSMLNRRAKRSIAVLSDGSEHDFEARTVPVYGAEVNVRLFVEDGVPDHILEEINALLASKGRVVRAQARPITDFRVNVIENILGEDFRPVPQVRAVNVLDAEVFEYMRNTGQGAISTTGVAYGAPAPIVGA